jgi:hypothetical protein
MSLAVILLILAGAGAQQPLVHNGRLDVRAGGSIAREVAAAGAADPEWIGWQVPMVPGDRQLCSTWSDGSSVVRGEWLEPRPAGERPAAPAVTGPVAIERGTSLVLLVRVVRGQVERLRFTGNDCQIDAGTRTVRWLADVTPDASIEYLDGLTRLAPPGLQAHRRIAESSVAAIGLHDAPAALAVLDRLTGPAVDAGLRRQAASVLAAARGPAGFTRVQALIRDERQPQVRRQLVSALAASGDAGVAEALLAIARSDADAGVRGEAASRYVTRADAAGIDTALELLRADADDEVRRRIVSALGSLPGNAGTPALIQIARSSDSLNVRKYAVGALGRSTDPAARALLEELLK